MDTFTENILARARERQKMLKEYAPEENVSSETVSKGSQYLTQNPRTRVSSELPGSPKNLLKTLNIQQENFNMEIKLSSSENIRVEVEIAEGEDQNNSNNDNGLRDESKKRLKQLGRLYSGGDEADISSPIHRTEAKFYGTEEESQSIEKFDIPKSPRKGLSKLAHLAETINQWEDEVHSNPVKNSPVKKSTKPPAPKPPVASPSKSSPLKASHKLKAPDPPVPKMTEPEKNIQHTSPFKQALNIDNDKETAQVIGIVHKKINWDKDVLDTLTSQGFTRTESNSRLVYSYGQNKNSINKSTDNEKETIIEEETVHNAPSLNSVKNIENEKENVHKINSSIKSADNRKSRSHNSSPVKSIDNQKPRSHNTSPIKISSNIADKTALFESSPSKVTKDPALLSVSERKALFEKNKGEALIPKAPFGMAPPVRVETIMKVPMNKIMSDKLNKPSTQMHKKTENVQPTLHKSSENVTEIKTKSSESVKPIVTTPKKTIESKCPVSPIVPQSRGIAKTMAALLENKSTISQTQIENTIKSERQKEMDMLLNRFQRNKVTKEIREEEQGDDEEEDDDDVVDIDEETPMLNEKPVQIVEYGEKSRKSAEKRKSGSKSCSKEDSPVVAAILDDVKRIKVSPPKAGRLYPNLSDIEATTETDTDYQTRTPTPEAHSSFGDNDESDNADADTSFGRDILQAIKNQTPQKRPIYDDSTASDLSSILDDDSYLEDILEEDIASVGPTPPKQVCQNSQAQSSKPSNSFNYKNFSNNNTPKSTKVVSETNSPKKPVELPNYVVEGDNVLPLTHTVSFYRKQQNQVHTPIRQITRLPLTSETKENVSEESELVEKKIKELQEEIHKQQNIISQTSQALNLCSCTPEFSGSTEQVEADRVLLLATHRRHAILNELQRLKIEKTLRPQGQFETKLSSEKGSLTISKIVLPLKHKYVKALAAAGGKGHHVVCLIKCCEQVVSTKLVSTAVSNVKNPDTELIVSGSVTLKNVYSDSMVTFEVYCLQAQEEFLPHEIKYHINKKTGNKLVTPKKSKDSKMIMPIKESPAGPQAVRTSSFALMGYVVFPVQAMNKKVFTLNNTPPMSPLEGTIEMRISCELAVSVEHRGFLTMFDDVSGFGAWHRRWCVLKGHTLSYWKYPDDEKKKAPIDSINLKNCITKTVGPVSREICARLHTFLLERERMAHPHDKDSLVTVCKGDKTIIRHLLSADTKEERIEWCEKFNLALNALRMWEVS